MAGEATEEKKTPASFDEADKLALEAYNKMNPPEAAAAPADTGAQTEPTAAPEATETAAAPTETVPAAQPAPAATQAAPPMTEAQIATEAAMRAAKEIAALKAELEQVKALTQQQSQAAETKIEETLLETPRLDLKDIAYLSDEEIAAREADYSQKMLAYTMSSVDKKMQPVLSQYDRQQKATEETSVLNDLRLKSPDIDKYLPEIQSFLGTDNAVAKALASLPPRERYVTGLLVAKGAAPVQQETPEQLVQKILGNPDAMRMLELQRVEKAKQNANIPPQSASSGMANIPVTPKARPKSIDEGYEMAKKAYGY